MLIYFVVSIITALTILILSVHQYRLLYGVEEEGGKGGNVPITEEAVVESCVDFYVCI